MTSPHVWPFLYYFCIFTFVKENLRGRPHLRDMTFHYCDFWSARVFLINKASTPFIFIITSSLTLWWGNSKKVRYFLSLGLLISCAIFGEGSFVDVLAFLDDLFLQLGFCLA
jgi:hypothetical protein